MPITGIGWYATCAEPGGLLFGSANAFYELDAPPARVCSEEVPLPYAKHLEDAALPLPPKIVAKARQMVARRP